MSRKSDSWDTSKKIYKCKSRKSDLAAIAEVEGVETEETSQPNNANNESEKKDKERPKPAQNPTTEVRIYYVCNDSDSHAFQIPYCHLL